MAYGYKFPESDSADESFRFYDDSSPDYNPSSSNKSSNDSIDYEGYLNKAVNLYGSYNSSKNSGGSNTSNNTVNKNQVSREPTSSNPNGYSLDSNNDIGNQREVEKAEDTTSDPNMYNTMFTGMFSTIKNHINKYYHAQENEDIVDAQAVLRGRNKTGDFEDNKVFNFAPSNNSDGVLSVKKAALILVGVYVFKRYF